MFWVTSHMSKVASSFLSIWSLFFFRIDHEDASHQESSCDTVSTFFRRIESIDHSPSVCKYLFALETFSF